MSDARVTALVEECEREAENCEYTSASLYVWHKRARKWNALFVIAPILLGGLASSQILTGHDAQWAVITAAFLALTAGFFPSIFEALKLDMRLREILQSANEFTNLRDRFRQAAKIKSYAPYDEFQAEFEALMDRMDSARTASPPVPDW
jgi:hypothetical protein